VIAKFSFRQKKKKKKKKKKKAYLQAPQTLCSRHLTQRKAKKRTADLPAAQFMVENGV